MRSYLSINKILKFIFSVLLFICTTNAEPIDTLLAYRNELASLTQPCSFKWIVNKRIGEVDCAHLFELLQEGKWCSSEFHLLK